jgi:hypothetical protein
VISKGLPDEWPPEVVEVAAQLQQGDLISEPPLVYAASLAYPIWALTRLEAEDGVDSDPVHLSLDRDDVPEWGIVVSQTCDVTEEEHEPVQPWVEVCPVYERDAVENAPEYLYPLNRMPAAEGRMWVADLRLTVSLEKGLLVGRQRRDPFDGAEEARIEFGVKLGERRARPALSAGVHVVITETLKKRRGNNKPFAKEARTRVYKLMLQVEQGSRLDPRSVRLHVICQPSDECTEERLREWFDKWWEKASEAGKDKGIELLPTVFHDRESMDIEVYDRLIPIENPM